MADTQTLLKDPEFWTFKPGQQRLLLSEADADFGLVSEKNQDLLLAEAKAKFEQSGEPGFFGGVWETLNPLESLKFAKGVFTTAPWSEDQPLNLMMKGSAEMHAEQFRKAQEAKGPGSTLYHGAAAAIPFLGPALAETGERIADPKTRSRGIGNLVGMAIPGLAAAGGRRIRPKVKIAGGPMTVGERLRSPTVTRGEGIIEGSVPGSGPFSRLRKDQQVYLSGKGDQIVSSLSKFEGASEELGIFIKKSLEADTAAIKKRAQNLYANIDRQVTPIEKRLPATVDVPTKLVGPTGEPIGTIPKKVLRKKLVGGIQPSTQSLKAEAVPLLRRLNQQAKLMSPEELKSARETLTRIANSPRTAPFGAFHDARKDLLAIARRIEKGQEPSSGRRHAVTLRLAGRMDKAMEDALVAGGRQDLLQDLRAANEIWRDLNLDYSKTLLAKLQVEAPEKAHRLLLQQGTSIEDIRKLRRHISKESFDMLVSRSIRDLIDEATEGELVKRAPGIVGQVLDLPEEVIPILNGKALGKRLEGLVRQGKLSALVDQKVHANLIEIVQISKSMRPRGGGLPSGMINVAVMSPMFYNPFDPTAMGSAAGYYAAVNLIARAVTTQRGSGLLRDVFKAASRGDRQLLLFSLKRMSELAERGELGASAQNDVPLQQSGPTSGAMPIPPPPSSRPFAPPG